MVFGRPKARSDAAAKRRLLQPCRPPLDASGSDSPPPVAEEFRPLPRHYSEPEPEKPAEPEPQSEEADAWISGLRGAAHEDSLGDDPMVFGKPRSRPPRK